MDTHTQDGWSSVSLACQSCVGNRPSVYPLLLHIHPASRFHTKTTVYNHPIFTSFCLTHTMLSCEEVWAEITKAKKCEMLKLCVSTSTISSYISYFMQLKRINDAFTTCLCFYSHAFVINTLTLTQQFSFCCISVTITVPTGSRIFPLPLYR